jgi:hypothetical protein
MTYLLLLPLIAQALAIFVDEFYFHFAPGQRRWERIGHPLDTFTVLAPVLWLMVSAPCERNLIIYTLAAVFSCCFVIKDELVHADRCAPAEHANQAAAVALNMIYQALYWNLIWKAPAAQFGARQ